MRARAIEVDRAVRALAAGQHGVVSRSQALEAGATPGMVRRWTSVEWEVAGPGVLRLVGSAASERQGAMAAVLSVGDGAVLSGLTAAHYWGVPGFPARPIHVSRSHGARDRQSPLAVVHHSRFLPAHHCTEVDAMPVTTLARTIFDLAARVHPARVERALDSALHRRLVPLEHLRAVAIELFARGRTGTVLMRELLAERGAGYIPVASGLEARFLALLVAAGVELPERQVDLGGESWVGRVDFYYRRLRLVIEIDGKAFHTSKLDREHDACRDAALRAGGFDVLHVEEDVLRERPWEVLAQVRAALGLAA